MAQWILWFMITVVKKIFFEENGEDGQGLVEFLLFLPLMLMFYSTILSISNALNASINQQKIARSYLYYILQNNSTYPKPSRRGEDPSVAWSMFGTQIIGWAESLDGSSQAPVAPCYKLNLPFESREDDACENKYSSNTTQFMRVKTVYGLCGATYVKTVTGNNLAFPLGNIVTPTSPQHCIIKR